MAPLDTSVGYSCSQVSLTRAAGAREYQPTMWVLGKIPGGLERRSKKFLALLVREPTFGIGAGKADAIEWAKVAISLKARLASPTSTR